MTLSYMDNNHDLNPDIVFGASKNHEGFAILHAGTNVNDSQKKSFELICRRLSWEATQEHPENLHALLVSQLEDCLILIHLTQDRDDKNRRAIKATGYLYQPSDHEHLLKDARKISSNHDIQFLDKAEEYLKNLGTGPVPLTETQLLKVYPEEPPTQDPGGGPEGGPSGSNDPPPLPFGTIITSMLLTGLLICAVGAFFLYVQPLKKEIEIMKDELESFDAKVSKLEHKNNKLANKNKDLRSELANANQSIQDKDKKISTLEEENSALRQNLSKEELKIKELMSTKIERRKLAERLREDARQHQSIAERLDNLADDIDPQPWLNNTPIK